MAGENEEAKSVSHHIVFTEVLESNLPSAEISVSRLQNEALGPVGAGFETTKWGLTVATYHILANPVICERLRQQLVDVIPDPFNIPSWAKLQALPYLSTCVKEG